MPDGVPDGVPDGAGEPDGAAGAGALDGAADGSGDEGDGLLPGPGFEGPGLGPGFWPDGCLPDGCLPDGAGLSWCGAGLAPQPLASMLASPTHHAVPTCLHHGESRSATTAALQFSWPTALTRALCVARAVCRTPNNNKQ